MAYEINWCDDVFPNEIDELLMLDNTDDDEDSDEFGEDENETDDDYNDDNDD